MPVRKKHKGVGRRSGVRTAREPAGAETTAQRLACRVRQIAFGLVLLGAALGPMAPTIESTLSLRLVVQMLFVLAGVLWALSMALEGRIRIRRTGLGVWLGLLCGAVISGTVNAGYKYPALLTAFMWFSSIVAFVFVVNEARSRRMRALLLGVIAASAFAVAVHGVHQVLVEIPNARAAFADDPVAVLRELNLPPEMAYNFAGRLGTNRVFSTFLLPNSLAGFLVLVLPMCLGLILDRFRERPRGEPLTPLVCRVILILPLGLALFLTKAKAGWLACAVALGTFAVWGFGKRLLRSRLHVLGFILGMAVVAFIAQFSGLFPPLRDYVSSSTTRAAYWRSGVMIFERHPFVGVGLDNYAEHYAAFKRPGDEEARRAHNDYVQLAAETGIIGLFAYLAFLARFWQRVRGSDRELVLPPAEQSGAVGGWVAY